MPDAGGRDDRLSRRTIYEAVSRSTRIYGFMTVEVDGTVKTLTKICSNGQHIGLPRL